MKEYLENRISSLSKEYSELLTKIGTLSRLQEADNNSAEWRKVEDRKSRIEELKEVLEFFKENNYTNS